MMMKMMMEMMMEMDGFQYSSNLKLDVEKKHNKKNNEWRRDFNKTLRRRRNSQTKNEY